MQLTINDVKDKHKNKPALIMCHGPSLNDISKNIKKYKDNGYILFGCNEWKEFYNVEPNYWVLCGCMIKELMNLQYEIKPTLIYSDSIDILPKNEIEDYIKGDYLPFYQRKDGLGNLSVKNTDMSRLTLQEELQKYTKYKEDYGIGSNVSSHMYAMAIIMGCNPIYSIGIDLDFNIGYAKHNDVDVKIDKSLNKFYEGLENRFRPFRADYLKQIDIINESAKKINVKLINLNKKSWYKNIEIGDFPIC